MLLVARPSDVRHLESWHTPKCLRVGSQVSKRDEEGIRHARIFRGTGVYAHYLDKNYTWPIPSRRLIHSCVTSKELDEMEAK